MNYGKEFKKFATKHQGVNAMYYDKIVAAMNPTNMTPYIIEERQLNISQLDVFSRLMMDRIIVQMSVRLNMSKRIYLNKPHHPQQLKEWRENEDGN